MEPRIQYAKTKDGVVNAREKISKRLAELEEAAANALGRWGTRRCNNMAPRAFYIYERNSSFC